MDLGGTRSVRPPRLRSWPWGMRLSLVILFVATWDMVFNAGHLGAWCQRGHLRQGSRSVTVP